MEEIDPTELKYVLYARKSTDDPQRQVRSIDDQIAECTELARRFGLKVVEIIQETKSAKKPHRRPLFSNMLRNLRSGKYDAVLAWHPDRLARNMKEGGDMIDMLDDSIIKDIKFVTFAFTNDAMGKTMLGMAFVMSKQYSDNLSQSVTRGVRRNFAEGKSPIHKHGYFRDENGLYQPDKEKFSKIRDAWIMRSKGISLQEIAQKLTEFGYERMFKSSGRKVLMSKQTLSDMFKDPFYYGILIQANQEVDLRTIQVNFQPMITEQEYIEVQRITDKRFIPYKKGRRHTYLPLKMMVVCSYCGNHMYPGASKGNSKRYLFYRCDGKYCPRKERKLKKNIRGKVIFNFIYQFIEGGLNFAEREYQQYNKGFIKLTQARREKLQRDIYSKTGMIKSYRAQVNDISYKLLSEKHEIVREVNERRLEEIKTNLEKHEADIVILKNQLIDPKKESLSLQQFLNLSKNAAKSIKSGDVVVKDMISRLIFLNLVVDDEKVVSYQLKPPFDELLKSRNVVLSRGKRT